MNTEFRVGIGYDVHALENGYDLIIGGVNIDFSKGSKGHSDGDALMHSIVDAILGGACLGDIGEYFPSQDKRWENSSSDTFLRFALKKVRKKGYKINNIDSNIIIQRPKIAIYKSKIRKNLSKIIGIGENRISIKAKTEDYLGYIGSSLGWSCHSIVTLIKDA